MKKAIPFVTISLLLIITRITGKEVINSKEHDVDISESEQPEYRFRRSVDDNEDNPFWANRGKKFALNANANDHSDARMVQLPSDNDRIIFVDKNLRHETPFWGNRGRRNSQESTENQQLPFKGSKKEMFRNILLEKLSQGNNKNFDGKISQKLNYLPEYQFFAKERREEENNPFWGNRGRRSDEETEESPFWGNRGRRDDNGPFWGSRGRRDIDAPFWGARGRREENKPLEYGGRRQDDMMDYLFETLQNIKNDLSVSMLKRDDSKTTFWKNKGRANSLQHIFNDKTRSKIQKTPNAKMKINDFIGMKSLRQDPLYVEQPYYIVVDRSSRSINAEDDPYFISRGKKKVLNEDFEKAVRGRRGIMEEIAKNAKNDPYFVTRGKKDISKYDQLLKARDLVCSMASMVAPIERKKRDLNDRDRNRRTMLKNLAEKLQNDPYFVSRGKKTSDLDSDEDKLYNFAKQIEDLCS